MSTFALRKIEAIKGRQEFNKLIVDGNCPFDDFENNLETQYKSELAGLYHNMQDVADLKSLPKTKFHFYDNDKKRKNKAGVREFEFKTKHLRVYGITQTNGKLVIMGGTKANQKTDQNIFRKLKNLFLSDNYK